MSSRFALLTVLALLLAAVAFALLTLRPVGTQAATARGRETQQPLASAPVVEQLDEAALPRTQVVREEPAAESSVQPEPEEQWLPVRVITAATYRHNAAPVASVEVAVGVGSANSPTAAVLATGTTDAEGVCELRIPWSVVEAARSGGGRIWARPSGTGWIEQTRHRNLPRTLEAVEIKLQPRRGFTVRGRLLGEHGEPTAGNAQAEGITLTGEQAHGFGSVDSEGWFEVHVDHAGTYDIVGRAPYANGDDMRSEVYAGTGVLRGVRIDASNRTQNLTLRLQGPGVVRGRVQTAAGQPVAGLELTLNSVRAGAAVGNGFRTYSRLLREGLGESQASVRTDTEGRFEVRGLRGNDFDVSPGYQQPLLNLAPIPSDGMPVVLVLDYTHLVVRLVDNAGEPWQGKLSTWRHDHPEDWEDAPQIVVAPTRENLARSIWNPFGTPGLVDGKVVENATLSFEVEPGGEYLVGLLGGPGAWSPTLVRVPESGGRVEVELRSGIERETGTLSLSVTDATGPIVKGIIVMIEDLDTGFTLLSKSPYSDATWPLELRIPAGSYRLAVEGSPSFGMHGELYARSAHGRFEADFAVAPGKATSLEAHLPAGARIDLNLTIRSDSSPETPDGTPAAQVRLLSEDRWPRSAHFPVEQWPSRSLRNYVSCGVRQTSERLPAGRFVLEVRTEGGRVASVPVTLVDGETLSVTLEL